MYLNMNLRDLELWEQGKLKMFAIPQKNAEEINAGQTVEIKEPFKKLTVTEEIEVDGEAQERKVPVGIMYRADKKIVWIGNESANYEEASRWSPASQLPEYAIRHHAIVTKVEDQKPIQAITEDELRSMCLDYSSQNNPQILLEEYLPIKNFELLYSWWKEHYKATLRDNNNPLAVLLSIQLA